MESTLQLNRGDLFLVSSWSEQIAVRFVRYGLIEVDPMDQWELACCEDEENQDLCDHSSDMCWIYSALKPEDDLSIAVVVMVGDDREHRVDAEDLKPVDAEQVCSCGSIGCFSVEANYGMTDHSAEVIDADRMIWIVRDWMNNRLFPEIEFDSFEDGWTYIYETAPEPERDSAEWVDGWFDDFYVVPMKEEKSND